VVGSIVISDPKRTLPCFGLGVIWNFAVRESKCSGPWGRCNSVRLASGKKSFSLSRLIIGN
jgi:hypothetical protein